MREREREREYVCATITRTKRRAHSYRSACTRERRQYRIRGVLELTAGACTPFLRKSRRKFEVDRSISENVGAFMDPRAYESLESLANRAPKTGINDGARVLPVRSKV